MPTPSQDDATNWLLIAAGTVLSTISICLGYKLKQGHVRDSKQKQNQNATNIQKGPSILYYQENSQSSWSVFLFSFDRILFIQLNKKQRNGSVIWMAKMILLSIVIVDYNSIFYKTPGNGKFSSTWTADYGCSLTQDKHSFFSCISVLICALRIFL